MTTCEAIEQKIEELLQQQYEISKQIHYLRCSLFRENNDEDERYVRKRKLKEDLQWIHQTDCESWASGYPKSFGDYSRHQQRIINTHLKQLKEERQKIDASKLSTSSESDESE